MQDKSVENPLNYHNHNKNTTHSYNKEPELKLELDYQTNQSRWSILSFKCFRRPRLIGVLFKDTYAFTIE